MSEARDRSGIEDFDMLQIKKTNGTSLDVTTCRSQDVIVDGKTDVKNADMQYMRLSQSESI
ncbi:hypothetical protein M8C21_027987 [Ambrosia artemisiifolia]|uniref:Uncharacterized protein n=1 Tax=Ambrosia artemisiifolia TaxID=4212 RepID=A0AAD5CWP5_AMBAR|nr:hypothetical protein M8C21_027987 [Ambrosia artemisiifolia]